MLLYFNGELRHEDEFLIRADNRGFRYGDGLFETMLVREGRIRLGAYHMERLADGMLMLRLELPHSFSLDLLEKQVAGLCGQNGLGDGCRARLTVFRAGAGIFNDPDNRAAYALQTSAVSAPGGAGNGLVLGVFPEGRKACDPFSAIKSNNYLLSSLAGIYARESGWDDCVLMNVCGRVAETTVANIWWVRQGRCYTPPLSEGCVAGVMRRHLLEILPRAGYEVKEEPAGLDELAAADELFISNAIRGIQWVQSFRGRRYGHELAASLQRDLVG